MTIVVVVRHGRIALRCDDCGELRAVVEVESDNGAWVTKDLCSSCFRAAYPNYPDAEPEGDET